jgi:hypothetical protein
MSSIHAQLRSRRSTARLAAANRLPAGQTCYRRIFGCDLQIQGLGQNAFHAIAVMEIDAR